MRGVQFSLKEFLLAVSGLCLLLGLAVWNTPSFLLILPGTLWLSLYLFSRHRRKVEVRPASLLASLLTLGLSPPTYMVAVACLYVREMGGLADRAPRPWANDYFWNSLQFAAIVGLFMALIMSLVATMFVNVNRDLTAYGRAGGRPKSP